MNSLRTMARKGQLSTRAWNSLPKLRNSHKKSWQEGNLIRTFSRFPVQVWKIWPLMEIVKRNRRRTNAKDRSRRKGNPSSLRKLWAGKTAMAVRCKGTIRNNLTFLHLWGLVCQSIQAPTWQKADQKANFDYQRLSVETPRVLEMYSAAFHFTLVSDDWLCYEYIYLNVI